MSRDFVVQDKKGNLLSCFLLDVQLFFVEYFRGEETESEMECHVTFSNRIRRVIC